MKKFTGLVTLFCVFNAIGQPGVVITTPDSLVHIYQSGLGMNLPLYNGRQFYGYSSAIIGNAFYPVNDWTRGSILYDNMWYNNVPIMYDAFKDELVTMHPNGVPFVLISDRVQEFRMKELVFVRLLADKNNGITTGFYQRLSTGKATAFAKRVRELEEKINGLEVERKFLIKDLFYVWKDNEFTKIRKSQSLLSVLNDKQGEVHQYLGQKKIRYKTDREIYIISVTDFYNKLSQ
jgi:hypothetical protein